MVEIRYGDYQEVADLTGRTVSEARGQFGAEFGIPAKAQARLNGKKVKDGLEAETCLQNDDKLVFAKAGGYKSAYLVGAMLLTLAITGGVFAYGALTTSTTFTVASGGGDFATVTENSTGRPSLTAYGLFKGTISAGNLFDIAPHEDFPSELVATVSIANADELVKVYRVMALQIEVRDSTDTVVDIEDNGEASAPEFAFLTLSNGSVDLYLDGTDNYTVKVKSGFYVSHVYSGNWAAGSTSPILYVDIGQR